jgi:hypothetical protein
MSSDQIDNSLQFLRELIPLRDKLVLKGVF